MITAYRLAIASIISTLVLIGVGVVVRATGSGLGCPDWPTCHGGLLPPGDKHPLIEVSHRVVASFVGLLIIALAVACRRAFRDTPRVWLLAAALVPMVGLQGLIGAVTVVRELPPAVVATHLITAFAILSALIVLTMDIHARLPDNQARQRGQPAPPLALMLVTMLLLGAAVWIGGYMTESGASAACPSWPGCRDGSFFGSDHQETIHMAHRYAVLAFTAGLVLVAARLFRASDPTRLSLSLAAALVGLLCLQITVGAINVWWEFPDALAVSHTVIASLIWSMITVAGVLAWRAKGLREVQAAATGAA